MIERSGFVRPRHNPLAIISAGRFYGLAGATVVISPSPLDYVVVVLPAATANPGPCDPEILSRRNDGHHRVDYSSATQKERILLRGSVCYVINLHKNKGESMRPYQSIFISTAVVLFSFLFVSLRGSA